MVVADYRERLNIYQKNESNENSNPSQIDNSKELAYHMARINGYPTEFVPFLQALVKSRRGNLEEAQLFLDEGKNNARFFLHQI